MGKKGYFATLLVLLLLVFFLFPNATGEEWFLVPRRTIDLDNQENLQFSSESGSLAFSLGEHFGYFSDSMELSYADREDFRVAIGDEAFINYSKVPAILDIQTNKGEGRAIIEASGYPLIEQNRIIVLSENRISLHDLEGNLFWGKEILSIVTTLSCNNGMVLIGYLDGSCELIDESGDLVLNYRPGGSRVEAIYSAAISGNSQTIVLIAGLDPQRFIILEKRKNEYKPVHHFELDHQYRRTVDMDFSSDGSKVFFENPMGVNVYTLATRELKQIGGTGRLENIYVDEEAGFYSMLLKKESSASLKVLTPTNRTLLERTFPGEDFYFRKEGDNYYIGSNNRLMYLTMEKG